MVLVAAYTNGFSQPQLMGSAGKAGTAGAAVGVGVILRSIARLLFRAGGRNFVRITLGTAFRTVSKTAISRTVRLFVRTVAAREIRGIVSAESSPAGPVARPSASLANFVSIGLGLIAVAASIACLHFIGDRGRFITDIPLSVLMIFSACPLLIIWGAFASCRHLFAVDPIIRTGIDGLLIQTYFALSGSYLPLSTEFSFRGPPRQCCRAAIFVLATLLAAFIATACLSGGNPSWDFASGMCLTYAFVYGFPVKPLLGHVIWRWNRVVWGITFAPILICFLFFLSDSVATLM